MANLNEERSLLKIAKTIFAFEIGQSCSLTGFAPDPDEVDGVSPRGKQVLAHLKDMYEKEYMRGNYLKKQVKIRQRKHFTNSIGGDAAHPIWRYKETVSNNQVKYNIWRIQ